MNTKLNADLHQRAVVESEALPWVDSPAAGIARRMLERDGAKVARATSIVRYAEGSRFPEHTHERGEEIFVLEGVFEDESGSWGTWIRSPHLSQHQPFSEQGCTILVKTGHLPL